MRSFVLFFIFLGLLELPLTSKATSKDSPQYILIPYNQAQGLMPSYIHDMATDSLGQLQLATYGSGMLSFDGIKFSTLGEVSLARLPITRKLHIEENLYYFVTENELFVWNSHTDSLKSLFKGETPILFYSKIDEEKMLISNYSGNFLISLTNSSLIPENPYKSFSAILNHIKLGNNQSIFITADKKFVLENNRHFKILLESKTDYFNSLVDHPLFYGVLGNEFFYMFDKTTFRLQKRQEINGLQNISATLVDEEKIWIGSQEGIFLWEKDEIQEVNTTPSLDKKSISSLVKTFDGTIWISTYGSGIFKLYDLHISKFSFEGEDLGNINFISKIKGTSQSFLVTSSKGIFLIDDQEVKQVKLPSSSSSPLYFSGVQDRHGNIWIGGEGYILRREKGEEDFTFIIHPVFENNLITCLVPSGNNIYMGSRKGLYLFSMDLELLNIFNEDSPVKPRNINHITLISPEKVIFGNSFNLFETDGHNIKPFEINEIDGKILSFERVKESLYWLGSSNGRAYLYDFASQEILMEKFLRKGKNVYSIAQLPDSSIVTGSEMGIERHYPDGSALLYDDRIRFSEVNYNSIGHTDQGNILVGTTEGLFQISGAYGFKTKSPPMLDYVSINQVPVGIKTLIHDGKPLTLAHHENNLSFNFNLINYQFPNDIRVRYQLKGFEDHWGPFGKPGPVQYNNLPPGEYTLYTNIQYAQGDELSYALPLQIFIRNPFWFHPAMMIGMLFFAFTSVYLGYIWFQRKTIQRNKKLSKLVDERTEEINKINKNLEQIIQIRTQDLHVKNDELVQTIHQKNKFQRYIKLISSNTKDIFCMVTENFEIRMISDSVEDLLGISARKLIKQNIHVLLAEEQSTAMMMDYIHHLPGQPLGLILPVLHKKTGNEIMVEILAKKIDGATPDEDLGYVLNLRDVTERESLKKELKLVYKNIHRDFHDEVGNKLAKIIALVSVMKIQFDGQPNGESLISKVEATAKNLYRDTRDFVWSLDQENNNLEDLSLQLRDFGDNLFNGSGISFNCNLIIRENLSLKPNLVRDILLIIKEIMTNVMKHSRARQIHLIIKQHGKQMVFLVKDDGIGIQKNLNGNGNGLKNIQFRVTRCKGELILKSRKGTLAGLRLGAEVSR